MTDLIERVAAWLYAFDGSPAVADAKAEQESEVYRDRAVKIVAVVRDHDAAGGTP